MANDEKISPEIADIFSEKQEVSWPTRSDSVYGRHCGVDYLPTDDDFGPEDWERQFDRQAQERLSVDIDTFDEDEEPCKPHPEPFAWHYDDTGYYKYILTDCEHDKLKEFTGMLQKNSINVMTFGVSSRAASNGVQYANYMYRASIHLTLPPLAGC